MLDQATQLVFGDLLDAFLNPQKRVYWGYLVAAFLIGSFWLLVVKRSSLGTSLKHIFSRQTWLSQSARADYGLMIINGVIMTLLSPKLLSNAAIATLLFSGLHHLFDGRVLIGANVPAEVIAIGFTLFLFVFDDFARYWLHRWLHTYSILWSFHKVHHSATSLSPITVFRTHPVEAILFSIRGALVQGISAALFIYFFGDKVSLVTVLSASLFNFVFNILGSNLRHSSISISYYRPIERFFMSPAQHHIHHSNAPEHIDKNFGVVLSFWDTCFGSFCYSEKNTALSFGLSVNESQEQHALAMLYIKPFKDAVTTAYRALNFNYPTQIKQPHSGNLTHDA